MCMGHVLIYRGILFSGIHSSNGWLQWLQFGAVFSIFFLCLDISVRKTGYVWLISWLLISQSKYHSALCLNLLFIGFKWCACVCLCVHVCVCACRYLYRQQNSSGWDRWSAQCLSESGSANCVWHADNGQYCFVDYFLTSACSHTQAKGKNNSFRTSGWGFQNVNRKRESGSAFKNLGRVTCNQRENIQCIIITQVSVVILKITFVSPFLNRVMTRIWQKVLRPGSTNVIWNMDHPLPECIMVNFLINLSLSLCFSFQSSQSARIWGNASV